MMRKSRIAWWLTWVALRLLLRCSPAGVAPAGEAHTALSQGAECQDPSGRPSTLSQGGCA